MAGRFADGAWLAELAPVRDPAQVPAVVAAALKVRDQPGVPVAEVLVRVLARQQLLLVLDNCEHVIGAAAELCAGLLAACDDVRVLATSREPLAVAGEARYRLGPLSLPGGDARDEAGGSEAVALFADRARQVDAGFTLDGQTGPVVAGLVARLDGMPLAIELAAARVEALGVSQLADRLDDRFALLTAGDRLAPGRQRSLAATVEWSYRLLGEEERRVFRAVSVFAGPFTLEAAEAVSGEGAEAVVLRLVDCSLLVPPVWRRSRCPRRAVLASLTVSVGVIRRVRETRGDGRRHRGHEEMAAALPVDLLAVTFGEGRPAVPEVAPGGNGTGFCGRYRDSSAGRAAAVPVPRGARPVGACPPAGDRDAGRLGRVLAAAVAVPFVPADACPSSFRLVVAAALRGRGDHGGAGAGGAGRGGGPGGSPAVAARSGRAAAGAGVDGPVVAVAVRLARGGPAGAGDAAAAAGGRRGGGPAAGAVGVAGR